jgi:hypothetical protein
MKIRHISLLLFLAGGIAVSAQTTNTSPSSALGVTFLYATNAVPSKKSADGIFQITNRLPTYLYIWSCRIQTSNQLGWTSFSPMFGSPGMIDPHEQFIFQTLVPDRGGLYRLELHTRNDGPNSEFFSQPFRISAGPPIKEEDIPHVDVTTHP